MRWRSLAFAASLTPFAAAPLAVAPQSAQAVDLALVLLNDVSNSMDAEEYTLVKNGYRAAFADPEVAAALIGNGGGVAVAYVEFSGKNDIHTVLDWRVLTDARSAAAFGEAIAGAPRSSAGNTALAAGIAAAARLLSQGDFADARRVIDVASDHPHDDGRSARVRDAAVANGITINALPIVDNRPIGTFDGHLSYAPQNWGYMSVVDFYLHDVVGGPGSFAVEARDYAVFGDALKRKLLLEFIAKPAPEDAGGAIFKVAAIATR